MQIMNSQVKLKYEQYVQEIKKNASLSQDNFLLERLYKLMERELDNSELKAEIIGKELGLSRAQVYRKVKALTKLSVRHFIRNYRLEKAKEMLKNPAYSITDIAIKTGFASANYFSTMFREKYGMCPREAKNKFTNKS